MIKKNPKKEDIDYILNHLRKEDIEELQAMWQGNWFTKISDNLKDKKILVVYGKDENKNCVPIAMGGFHELFEKNSNIACIWLLSTNYVKNNKTLFIKELKHQISKASEKYELMYNYIYKSNKEAKNWLHKLGFNFGCPNPQKLNIEKDFEFFYKLTKRKENKCV